jgi:hypothetical protein
MPTRAFHASQHPGTIPGGITTYFQTLLFIATAVLRMKVSSVHPIVRDFQSFLLK